MMLAVTVSGRSAQDDKSVAAAAAVCGLDSPQRRLEDEGTELLPVLCCIISGAAK